MAVAVDLELTPSLEEVRELAKEHSLVPLRHTFIADCETPVSAYLKLRGDGPSFLLESAEQGQQVGRWSFLGFRPRAVIRLARGEHPDPYRLVDEELARYRIAPLEGLPPFAGGAVGMFGYDLARSAEPTVGEPNPDDDRHARAGRDGHGRAARLRPPAPRGDGAGQRRRRGRRRARLRGGGGGDRRGARAPAAARFRAVPAGRREPPEYSSNMGADGYAAAVERAKEYIRAGDIYQVVPSQRWSADCPVDAFSIYRGLRAINPSPYMYFLDFEDFEIAGASPETLITVNGRVVAPAPDRRHAAARRLGRARPRACARAARGPQGARRARDARGPGPQRPRARLRVRLGEGRRADGRRDLLARDAHRLAGVRDAPRRRHSDGRAARVPAGRHALGRAEDPRDADHRRARAGRPRALRRRRRATSPTRATSTPASTSAPRS